MRWQRTSGSVRGTESNPLPSRDHGEVGVRCTVTCSTMSETVAQTLECQALLQGGRGILRGWTRRRRIDSRAAGRPIPKPAFGRIGDGHTRRFWRYKNKFRPWNRPFPTHLSPKAAGILNQTNRTAQGRSQSNRNRGQATAQLVTYTIYVSVCRKLRFHGDLYLTV